MKTKYSVKLEKIEFEEEPVVPSASSYEMPVTESALEFREFYQKLSSEVHFPALESLLTINNFSTENVLQFCSKFKEMNNI